MSKYLSDFQFGVGVAGGAKAVLHSVNGVLSEYHNDRSLAMLTVDFSNAFNLVDRSALLHEQGDPLRPLLFALILHSLLHKIKDSCKLLLHAWYLDDGTVIRDSEEVARVLDIIKVSGLGLGLELNIKKTEIFWPSCNGMKLRKGLFLVDIRRPSSGVKLLGGADFLLAIPIDGLGQHMSPVEYCTILKYRLMIPLFPVDGICPVCRKACLDSFGEHAVHCKELPRFKYRHDMARDVLFDICRRAGISAKKEAPVNFLTDPSDGRFTLRPADVLDFGWVGGKHACVDLTGVSPLVGLSSRGFTVGQASLKAVSGKVTKHEKACIKNQHVFIPFAFDTFGFLAPEAVELVEFNGLCTAML
ncbi:putative reverse transcriptase domain-containing protein [Tanacetum coccineum]